MMEAGKLSRERVILSGALRIYLPCCEATLDADIFSVGVGRGKKPMKIVLCRSCDSSWAWEDHDQWCIVRQWSHQQRVDQFYADLLAEEQRANEESGSRR